MDPSNIGIERTIIATLLRDNNVFEPITTTLLILA